MKKNIIISFCVIFVTILLGVIYFGNNKSEVKEFDDISGVVSSDNKTSVLPPQAGLPALVEAKRQAIYKAALSRDLEKLQTEASAEGPIFTSFKNDGRPPYGFSGWTIFQEEESKISIFDLIPKILKLEYSVLNSCSFPNYPQYKECDDKTTSQNIVYVWPSPAGKLQKDWTISDINNMREFLSDEQIKFFQIDNRSSRGGYNVGYAYFNIVITADGQWTYGYLSEWGD